jgi:uncharacterized LabA/DUF88 family protein
MNDNPRGQGMKKKINNYAFIDSQNLNMGIRRLGWKMDFRKLRKYLKEKYGVRKAYLFIGYLPENQNLYRSLQEYGFVLIFKPILKKGDGNIKGNVDAELVLQAMIDYNKYERAVIISSDGDFYCLVNYLYEKKKLAIVISPCYETCSILLKRSAKEKIVFINNLRKKLGYEKAPQEDRTSRGAISS